MIVLLFIIYSIPGGYLMFPVFALVIYLMYQIQIPNSFIASQILGILQYTTQKGDNFMSETIRGTTTICAFKQERKTIKQLERNANDLILVVYFCWATFAHVNSRTMLITQLLPISCIILCILNKGTVSNVLLCTLYYQTNKMLEGLILIHHENNNFRRHMLFFQHILDLQNAP